MPTSGTNIASSRKVEYLSPPAKVSMADRWFEIASADHFWVRRRFEVLERLAGNLLNNAGEMAEIGCGHGVLQKQVEERYGRELAGFDLNEYALKQNVSQKSRVYCYDIFQQHAALRARFDVVFLFDVLEHIAVEDGFLEAVLFHLAPQGKIVLNVPSGQWAYSEYDRAVGHVRRYSVSTLRQTGARCGIRIQAWTYWGLPLIPTLALRKLWFRGDGKGDNPAVISSGFDSRSRAINNLLWLACQCEVIPQHWWGTSLMAILERDDGTSAS